MGVNTNRRIINVEKYKRRSVAYHVHLLMHIKKETIQKMINLA